MMNRRLFACVAAAALACAGSLVRAQNPPAAPTAIPDIKFSNGQSVVPYLEGWIRNPDETCDFVFGYFNRNTEEALTIPPGPNNSVTPGGPDRGQPTFFQTRRQPRIFRLRVPKDWGDKTVTWSITANGRTEKVVSRLLPSEEINERMMIAGGNNTMQFGEEDQNTPPTIALEPMTSASVGAPLTLVAKVVDDGLPRPRPPAPVAPRPPQPTTTANRFQSQRNSSASRPPLGLRVTWVEYRGPAQATFETNPVPVANGTATTTVRFPAPGSYTLVAMANDGRLSARVDTEITVK
jgi:hypothetical protein